MTTKERLHQLVDALDEESADRLLDAALALNATQAPATTPLPSFVGSIRSGTHDTSERAEVILRNELGVTVDRRDFGIVRPRHVTAFTLLPEPG